MGDRDDPIVRRAHVETDDPQRAAAGLVAELDAAPSLVVAFASSSLDPDRVAAALAGAFPGVPLIGCTSWGELGPAGDRRGSIAAMSITSPGLRVGLGLARDLRGSALRSSRAAVGDAAAALGVTPEQLDPARHVGIALVDGRSGYEESFCLGSAATVPQLRMVGGSASDDLGAPTRARVFFDGRAWANAGVVALLETDLPFTVIESEHMEPTDIRVVVTAADPEHRRVLELDGFPAARRYASLIASLGGPPLDSVIASSFPFALYVGDRPYVRSVAVVDGDTLVFASAVDPGSVLRLMRPGDLVGETEAAFATAAAEVGGELRAVIAFSCRGRHHESITRGTRPALTALYGRVPLVGFHSFGEQTGALLVNHTLTGLALGGRGDG
ncbi:MAG: FIST C-terminal domain-containing protein [Kofleriaceae bacterium]|nr:FIST C-terminal domain-containing protein [Myxococcales bacterium]MCB9559838.1 FIST C-terminal domain-containing protein [Kofleriaceae bacterium]MCB9571449.1 FIST C-terminal domain-containing protein [Kofleriaceae bacterium]